MQMSNFYHWFKKLLLAQFCDVGALVKMVSEIYMEGFSSGCVFYSIDLDVMLIISFVVNFSMRKCESLGFVLFQYSFSHLGSLVILCKT